MNLISLVVAAGTLIAFSINTWLLVRFSRSDRLNDARYKAFDTYQALENLKIKNPSLSYMFDVEREDTSGKRNSYKKLVEFARKVVGEKFQGESGIAKFKLLERSVAMAIFQEYQRVLEHKNEKKTTNRQVSQFFEKYLSFFENELLRNPRLLYYWNDENQMLQDYFEIDTRNRYDWKVKEDEKKKDINEKKTKEKDQEGYKPSEFRNPLRQKIDSKFFEKIGIENVGNN